jgi:hypothetical protein
MSSCFNVYELRDNKWPRKPLSFVNLNMQCFLKKIYVSWSFKILWGKFLLWVFLNTGKYGLLTVVIFTSVQVWNIVAAIIASHKIVFLFVLCLSPCSQLPTILRLLGNALKMEFCSISRERQTEALLLLINSIQCHTRTFLTYVCEVLLPVSITHTYSAFDILTFS